MEIADLIAQNPWWKDPLAIESDPRILESDAAGIPWISRMKVHIHTDRDRIYTLRGPRQVGKTTLVKLLVRELLLGAAPTGPKPSPGGASGGHPPRSVFYFSCDMLRDERELKEVIELYLDFSDRPTTPDRRYIFIDEVSSVGNWEKAIKYLVDAGRLGKCVMVLTGSHSLEIRHSIERLPGRRGEGQGNDLLNKVLLPMKFSEYVKTLDPRLRKEMAGTLYSPRETRLASIFDLFEGRLGKEMLDDYRLYEKDIQRHLDGYLTTGGTIRAIEEFHSRDTIHNLTYEIYIRSLIGDMARWRYRENITRQVLRSVMEKMTTSVSLQSIAEENEIGSHNTVSSYLSALEDSYVVNNIYQMELHKDGPSAKRSRKVYFVDPFIYHAVDGWVHGDSDYFRHSEDTLRDPTVRSRLVEMVVADHLIRFAYRLKHSDVFSHHDCLFFWRKRGSDREVDFVLRHDGKLFPLEVKYRSQVRRRDLTNLFTFRKGILASRNSVDTYGRYAIVPVGLVLMLI